MAAIPNLYDPTQFQFLGTPTAPMNNWAPQVAVNPMGNDRQLPDWGAQPGFTMGGWGQPASSGLGSVDANSTWATFQKWMKDSGMLGSTDANGIKTEGWGGLALGGASAVGNLLMGLKQYNLARDTLNLNKEAFSKNFEAQRKSTNAALNDRQAARVASNSGAYESVGDYMKKYGV